MTKTESETRRCIVGYISDVISGPVRMEAYERIGSMAFQVARDHGLMDVQVDFQLREVNGLPKGDGRLVADAYRNLADLGAVAVIGPMVTDNCTFLKPTVEQIRVPSIAWCGSSAWLGPWTFSLPNGGLLDEGPLLALYAHRQGWRRVAVFRDDSEIGETYFRHFNRAAQRLGLEIAVLEVIDRLASDPKEELRRARDANPDGLIYLGYGMSAVGMAPYFRDWNVPRIATTAYVFSYRSEFRAAWEGWAGLDQVDPANTTRQAFLRHCRERLAGWEPDFMPATLMYDSARAIAEGLALAPELTPAGVREGLEGVRQLPAASGGAGTTTNFGPYGHKGWEGTRYLVMGQLREGKHQFLSYIDGDAFAVVGGR
jgi:ABC-type branched-subunit amino acid transport system substrate-binding protein